MATALRESILWKVHEKPLSVRNSTLMKSGNADDDELNERMIRVFNQRPLVHFLSLSLSKPLDGVSHRFFPSKQMKSIC